MKQKAIIIAFCEQITTSGGYTIKRKRMTVYLDPSTLAALNNLERDSGKSASQIINEAVDYMARRDNILMSYVQRSIAAQTVEIEQAVQKIIRAELHNQ